MHSPDRQATSATPGSSVQSIPTGENGVRGNTQPPPARGDGRTVCQFQQTDKQEGQKAQALTAFEIARCVDALPCAGGTTKDTAGRPFGSHLSARTTPNPPSFTIWHHGRRTRRRSYALVIAEDRRRLAFAICRGVLRERCEPIRALESAGTPIDTGGGAVIWVITCQLTISDLRDS